MKKLFAVAVLGERSDGGVFYVEMFEDNEFHRENAMVSLDQFLDADLVPSSVGKFNVDPNFYISGMSPARL